MWHCCDACSDGSERKGGWGIDVEGNVACWPGLAPALMANADMPSVLVYQCRCGENMGPNAHPNSQAVRMFHWISTKYILLDISLLFIYYINTYKLHDGYVLSTCINRIV